MKKLAYFLLLMSLAIADHKVIFASQRDPAHAIEYIDSVNSSKGSHDYKITYSDGSSAVYDGWHKPVILNGALLNCDVITSNNRTLVPLRIISESLGGSVDWNAQEKKITIAKEGSLIQLTAGSKSATVNGSLTELDVEPVIFNDRAYVPIRFIAESFGAAVSYSTHDTNYDDGSEGYMIVPYVTGNIIIDLEGWHKPAVTNAEAVDSARKKTEDLFSSFKSYFDEIHLSSPQTELETIKAAYDRISADIKAMDTIGETAGYFVLKGPKVILVDKYTGILYYRSESLASSTLQILNGSEEDYKMFILGYLY
ncbi:MAG: copper amine oxidase N-terminal domain-containing protein [Clostridiales bacterium]|nr:copper amine oxidase N-terminal domain-containing protein [Clostridiales bacterium]